MTDLSRFKKIRIVGDIHGSLKKFKFAISEHLNNFSEESCLVFCGDYIDRGNESESICEFLFNLFEHNDGREFEIFTSLKSSEKSTLKSQEKSFDQSSGKSKEKSEKVKRIFETVFFISGNHEVTPVAGFDSDFNLNLDGKKIKLTRSEVTEKFNYYLNLGRPNFVPFCFVNWNDSPIIISHASLKNLNYFDLENLVWGRDLETFRSLSGIEFQNEIENFQTDSLEKNETVPEKIEKIGEVLKNNRTVNIHGHDHRFDKDQFLKDFNFSECDVSLDYSDNKNKLPILIIERPSIARIDVFSVSDSQNLFQNVFFGGGFSNDFQFPSERFQIDSKSFQSSERNENEIVPTLLNPSESFQDDSLKENEIGSFQFSSERFHTDSLKDDFPDDFRMNCRDEKIFILVSVLISILLVLVLIGIIIYVIRMNCPDLSEEFSNRFQKISKID